MKYTPEQLKNPIRVPAGKCPLPFESICDSSGDGCLPTEMIIWEWFRKLRAIGLRRGQFLTAEAIAYYARTEFDPNGAEYAEIRSVIYEYARSIADPFAPDKQTT